ncbi:TfoX/Sxy family DNA transformation protein [Sphingomonas sp. LR60]|uniref:TfoX/Sxy family DNA transformation protein n=1 Tax=Sphingomonas sp. LR60 TaxID=3050233 RepID=UPI002FE0CB7E
MTTFRCDAVSASIARLVELKNVCAKSAGWLIDVGVDSPERLVEIGAVEAYCRIKAAHPRDVSLCAVWALQGAIDGVASHHLPADVKQALKDAVKERQ